MTTFAAERERLATFATADPGDYWERVWMCDGPGCAYRVVEGPTCPRGHTARRGWLGNFLPGAHRPAATTTTTQEAS
jgi:hypothetical protein